MEKNGRWKSIFRNRDDEQQIRELSRVDSRRSEFSKREHIDEFFHRRIGIPLRDFVLKLFKNIARNRNSCGTCKFVCSKINFPLVDPPSPPLINIFDDGSSHFPRDEFSKLTVWQKLWNRVSHDPTHDSNKSTANDPVNRRYLATLFFEIFNERREKK